MSPVLKVSHGDKYASMLLFQLCVQIILISPVHLNMKLKMLEI